MEISFVATGPWDNERICVVVCITMIVAQTSDRWRLASVWGRDRLSVRTCLIPTPPMGAWCLAWGGAGLTAAAQGRGRGCTALACHGDSMDTGRGDRTA